MGQNAIGDWKEAWESAKKRAKIRCRFHDLRHTGCTRMLERGVPFATVAVIMGWSPAAIARMAKRYGHIGQSAQRQAVAAINDSVFDPGSFAFPFDAELEPATLRLTAESKVLCILMSRFAATSRINRIDQ